MVLLASTQLLGSCSPGLCAQDIAQPLVGYDGRQQAARLLELQLWLILSCRCQP